MCDLFVMYCKVLYMLLNCCLILCVSRNVNVCFDFVMLCGVCLLVVFVRVSCLGVCV